MTYGEFKKECLTNNFARYLLQLWAERKIALYPAIELYEKIKNKTKT